MNPLRLCIGILREIKSGEYRVAGFPDHVQRLRGMGCRVVVQAGAGVNAAVSDREYEAAGAERVINAEALYAAADLVWKIKEILPEEFGLVRDGQTVFTYLHPSLFARTASRALSEVTWPFVEGMVRQGVEQTLRDQGILRRGVVVWRGRLVGADLGRCQHVATLAPDDLLHEF